EAKGSLNPGTDPQWKYLTEHDPKFEGQRKLKIEGKELVSVPLRVFGLEGLQVLEMSPERESCLRYRMELIPREISHLRSLTLLYMDSNNLKEIPAEIGTLSNLERLTLSNNHLTSLPPEIGGLEKLHSLHLANNNFTELPAQVCQLRQLTFLDFSDNQISTLLPGIHHLQKLETLLLLFNSLKQDLHLRYQLWPISDSTSSVRNWPSLIFLHLPMNTQGITPFHTFWTQS
uniref:Disease resistance R13L4/SHOC-2-like LRR domain-containing protein n=1 Tax=Gopherus agassizii TaxID=38772 RepID=A0A452IVH5_9SAUR